MSIQLFSYSLKVCTSNYIIVYLKFDYISDKCRDVVRRRHFYFVSPLISSVFLCPHSDNRARRLREVPRHQEAVCPALAEAVWGEENENVRAVRTLEADRLKINCMKSLSITISFCQFRTIRKNGLLKVRQFRTQCLHVCHWLLLTDACILSWHTLSKHWRKL